MALFTKDVLYRVFSEAMLTEETSKNSHRIFSLRDKYCETIDDVVRFLQGKNPMLAHSIVQRSFLPEAERFAAAVDLLAVFGNMGIQDHAKYLATLYLEDIADFIKECIDNHFGFSRYAERLARSAASFDKLYEAIENNHSIIDEVLKKVLLEKITILKPTCVLLSVPFPGNVYGVFRIAKLVK